MKNIVAIIACLLTGCVSTPVLFSSVGPAPYASSSAASNGQLEVFSALEGHAEGDNPTWFQHSDYYLYTPERKLLKHVWNTIGHYEQAPKWITLPAGTYIVKARAKDYFWVELPVLIRSGQSTVVHLDDMWTPPAGTQKTKVVYAPDGHPVGWSATPPDEKKE